MIKRAFDVAVSSALLAATAPILLGVGAAIAVKMGRPVVFLSGVNGVRQVGAEIAASTCGKWVILLNHNYPGWLAGLIEEHQCGFVVPPEEPAAFADALIRAADDRPALRKMGESARRLAESDFGRPQLAERFVGFLETSAAR